MNHSTNLIPHHTSTYFSPPAYRPLPSATDVGQGRPNRRAATLRSSALQGRRCHTRCRDVKQAEEANGHTCSSECYLVLLFLIFRRHSGYIWSKVGSRSDTRVCFRATNFSQLSAIGRPHPLLLSPAWKKSTEHGSVAAGHARSGRVGGGGLNQPGQLVIEGGEGRRLGRNYQGLCCCHLPIVSRNSLRSHVLACPSVS